MGAKSKQKKREAREKRREEDRQVVHFTSWERSVDGKMNHQQKMLELSRKKKKGEQ